MKFDYNNIPPKTRHVKPLSYKKINGEAKDVDLEDPDLFDKMQKLGWKLVKTCVLDSGIGLAAPQIGIPRKCFVMVDVPKPDVWKFEGTMSLVINPTIAPVRKSERATLPEGCLSVPGKTLNIARPREVIVTYWYFNNKGKLMCNKAEQICGHQARIFQHECLFRRSVISTEDGPKTIGEIVDKRYSGKVYCLDRQNKLALSRITGWSAQENKNKKAWVRIKTSKTGPNKQLICTEEHPCAVVDRILEDPTIEFLPAKALKNKYIVRRVLERARNSEIGLYNADQVSVLVGGLLGDTYITERGEVVISHGAPQKEYAEYKARLLNGVVKKGYSGFRKAWTNNVVRAPVTEQTKLLRSLSYFDKKHAAVLVEHLNPLAVAIWYMDDGCLTKKKYAQFHTEGFSYCDHVCMKEALKEKFDLDAVIQKRQVRNQEKYYLRLNKKASLVLFEMISSYVIPSMRYKLPAEFKNVEFKEISNQRLDYSCKEVAEVAPVARESRLYDLTVEDNHNFFADNTLVHNCDHLYGMDIVKLHERQNAKPRRGRPKGSKNKKKLA